MPSLKAWATAVALAVSGLGLVMSAHGGSQQSVTPALPRRPNILFLFADDMRAVYMGRH